MWNFVSINNSADMLFFTNYFKMHRLKISSIKEMKASSFGEFLPAIFKFEEGELILKSIYVEKYFGSVLFFYENGKAVKVDINSYKTNRKKLLNAYYSGSKLINIFFETNSSYYKFACYLIKIYSKQIIDICRLVIKYQYYVL